jgi:hypothetical protein
VKLYSPLTIHDISICGAMRVCYRNSRRYRDQRAYTYERLVYLNTSGWLTRWVHTTALSASTAFDGATGFIVGFMKYMWYCSFVRTHVDNNNNLMIYNRFFFFFNVVGNRVHCYYMRYVFHTRGGCETYYYDRKLNHYRVGLRLRARGII